MATTAYGTVADHAAKTAARLRRGKKIDVNVVLGPIVWEVVGDMRRWYFVVGCADHKGAHFDQIAAAEKSMAEEFRAALSMALVQYRPIVLHDVADELVMARLCEVLWQI